MTDRKKFLTISMITDDDCGMYQIGELDGGFDEQMLGQYLERHEIDGFNELCRKMCFLQMQICNSWRRHNSKQCGVSASGSA